MIPGTTGLHWQSGTPGIIPGGQMVMWAGKICHRSHPRPRAIKFITLQKLFIGIPLQLNRGQGGPQSPGPVFDPGPAPPVAAPPPIHTEALWCGSSFLIIHENSLDRTNIWLQDKTGMNSPGISEGYTLQMLLDVDRVILQSSVK